MPFQNKHCLDMNCEKQELRLRMPAPYTASARLVPELHAISWGPSGSGVHEHSWVKSSTCANKACEQVIQSDQDQFIWSTQKDQSFYIPSSSPVPG